MIKDITVYQLVDSRGPGGIESHILHLSNWLTTKGMKCEVIFLQDHGPHPLKETLSDLRIQYRSVKHYLELSQLLKHTACLLCTHGYKAGIIGRILAVFTRTPVISTYHSGDMGSGKLKLYSLLDRYTSFLADEVISVSSEIAEKLPVSSTKINNFVPKQPILPQRGKAVAFVGRLSYEKDPVLFAKATRELDIPCHIYGDGPLMGTLKREFKHPNLFGHVDMSHHWNDIGLLCITSKFEGLPLVALEAMIRGIPIISFSVGGLPDLVINNKNGWIIPNRNEKKLRNAILFWAKLPQTDKSSLAISAHYHIHQHYSDEKVCPQIISIYERALSRRIDWAKLAKR